jgi:hypothetical protein
MRESFFDTLVFFLFDCCFPFFVFEVLLTEVDFFELFDWATFLFSVSFSIDFLFFFDELFSVIGLFFSDFLDGYAAFLGF